ncbi:peptidase [Alistipes putredinis]|uniref:peptidase n=1 Tax=Alistipes putredinis TaxID=28117 RepID=UPI00242F7462|nr:peptidase [Alistipes putredinis]MBS6651455.1 peptidase [Alistipes putredinis]
MNRLWKVVSLRTTGKLAPGMSVEIVKTGTSAKPTIKEIGEAFRRKYGIVLPNGCSLSYFDIQEMK